MLNDHRTLDPMTTRPDMVGNHGRAWKVDLREALRLAGMRPEEDAALEVWIVEAPWAHPVWHSYAITLMHLRPMPGRETTFHLEGASHEMWVDALDPNVPRDPTLKNAQCARLQPSNFAAQMIEETDDTARARIEGAVHAILDGYLSPDTDFSHQWVTFFGDNMMKR